MAEVERHSGDPRKIADAYFRLLAMGCEKTIAFWESNLPDPQKQPVTSKLVGAYLIRLELQATAGSVGLQAVLELTRSYPTLHAESHELGQWLDSLESASLHPKRTPQAEGVIGDFLVEEMGFSFAHAKEILEKWASPSKGAPNKHGHTLRMLDSRSAKGWSYATLATKMCDCDLKMHDHLCRERIRKRIKDLEGVLLRYGIQFAKKRRK